MRILGTRKLLYLTKISDSSSCRLCGTEDETIVHLFVECTQSKRVWQNLEQWIYTTINVTLNFSPLTIILGYLSRDSNFLPINTILIVTKYYIFNSAQTGYIPDIFVLQRKIKKYILSKSSSQMLTINLNLLQNNGQDLQSYSRFDSLFSI